MGRPVKSIALLFIVFALTGCKQQTAISDSDATNPIRSVKYITTVFQSHTQTRELTVSKGQRVEKGQVLARLETKLGYHW